MKTQTYICNYCHEEKIIEVEDYVKIRFVKCKNNCIEMGAMSLK